MQFFRIVETSNWGSLSYTINGVEPADGDRLKVQLPDGKVIAAKVVMRPHYNTVSDWGHSYDVTTQKLEVKPNKPLKFHGYPVLLADFTKFKVALVKEK